MNDASPFPAAFDALTVTDVELKLEPCAILIAPDDELIEIPAGPETIDHETAPAAPELLRVAVTKVDAFLVSRV